MLLLVADEYGRAAVLVVAFGAYLIHAPVGICTPLRSRKPSRRHARRPQLRRVPRAARRHRGPSADRAASRSHSSACLGCTRRVPPRYTPFWAGCAVVNNHFGRRHFTKPCDQITTLIIRAAHDSLIPAPATGGHEPIGVWTTTTSWLASLSPC